MAFISVTARLDDKGRVTIPSEVRNRLNLDQGDQVRLQIETGTVILKDFSSKEKALEYLSEKSEIKSFSFENGVLEVILDD